MFDFRTDLATERRDIYKKANQIENEIRSTKAQAEKKIAEAEGNAKSILVEAEAQAKANKVLSASLTPEFVQYQALQKWDGKLPTTMVPNSGLPVIPIK